MFLDKWYALRLDEKRIKAEIKSVEGQALDELLAKVEAEGKKTISIGDPAAGHVVQAVYKDSRVGPKDSAELAELDRQAKDEEKNAAVVNAEEIADIEMQIADLKDRLDGLQTTAKSRTLRRQYDTLAKSLVVKVPSMSLKGVK